MGLAVDWERLSAMGSVGSFLLAVIAAIVSAVGWIVTARKLGREKTARENAESTAAETETRAQAALVAAWFTRREVGRQGMENGGPIITYAPFLIVRNLSAKPVFDVSVAYSSIPDQFSGRIKFPPVIAVGEEYSHQLMDDRIRPEMDFNAAVTFRDHLRRRWTRYYDGVVVELAE